MNTLMGSDTIQQELQAFVTGKVVRRRANLTADTPLVESGLVDSMGLIQIVAYIDERYGVNLTQAGGPEDFRSISSLAAAVCRVGQSASS
jgi:acyl carrier protein